MQDNNFYVYLHVRLDKNTPFYVGKGRKYRASATRGRNDRWKNIVNKAGYKIKYLLKDLSENEALEKEKYFIKFFKSFGFCEANFSLGGDGTKSFEMTEETKKKISQNRKGKGLGRICSEETRRKIGEKQIGEKNHRYGKPALNKGKHHSQESREKMSKAHKGKKIPKEILDKRIIKRGKDSPRFGKTHTEEARKIISEKLKGRKLSPEQIKKSRDALLPIIQSEEYKQKMRESTRYLSEARQKKLIDSNGIIYNSIKEASEKLKINKSTIHRFLKGINKTLKIGITLKYYIEDERIQGQ